MKTSFSFHKFCLVVAALALGSGLVLAGCGGQSAPAEPVTSFTPFVASDKSFGGEGPTGWETESGDLGATIAKVTFDKDAAHINITSDTASSFLADAMRNSPKPAVEILHERGLKKLEEKYSEIEPGKLVLMNSPLGQARYCEFNAKEGSTPVRGYRATIQGPERVLYVTQVCPESDWTTLQPAFSKVMGSLKAGA